MILKLNKKYFDYLNDNLLKKEDNLKFKLLVEEHARYIFIEMDVETANEIRDWAGSELQRSGFDINYKLTNDGEILESLIDMLYIE